jgi:hypothetical protein
MVGIIRRIDFGVNCYLSGLGVETVYPGHGKPFPLSELPIPGR